MTFIASLFVARPQLLIVCANTTVRMSCTNSLLLVSKLEWFLDNTFSTKHVVTVLSYRKCQVTTHISVSVFCLQVGERKNAVLSSLVKYLGPEAASFIHYEEKVSAKCQMSGEIKQYF